ncbi:MAG: gamma carbonic anhydrase family protein [Candidatus Hodarchaeaceae archaeon]|nr:gamma carbonic anhydrase family protein [Candidatus Hodarchaeaceae archaeon]
MLQEFDGKRPRIHPTAFVHPAAVVIGDVTIGEYSSVWPGAVVRGDFASVKVGRYTCVQDNTVVHAADIYEGKTEKYLPVKIGDYVIVGHNALLHGCAIANDCIVGAGSIVFNGARVREGALVGMGAVVLADVEVPPRTIVIGIPARPLRRLTDEEFGRIRAQAKNYAKLARLYKSSGVEG